MRTKKSLSPNAAAGITVQAHNGPGPQIIQGEALRAIINGQGGPGSPVQVVEGVVYQALGQRSSIDEKKQSATFTILTTKMEANRHGNRVHVGANTYGQGMRLEEWRKNPIVYFEHGFTDPMPIGLSEDGGAVHVEVSGDESMSATCFFHGLTQTSDDVWKLVRANIIRMASIGFAPELALPLVQSESEKQAKANGAYLLQSTWLEIFQSEMTEWSITPLGVDRGAMRQAIDRRRAGGDKLGNDTLAWMALHAEPRKMNGIGWQQSAGAPAPQQVQLTVVVQDERTGVVQGQVGAEVAGKATPSESQPPAPAVPEIAQSAAAPSQSTIVIPAHPQPAFDPAALGQMLAQSVMAGMKPMLEQQAQAQAMVTDALAALQRGIGTF